MKKGNHRLFLRDLEDRMADVRHTQAIMSNNTNAQDLENISPTVRIYTININCLNINIINCIYIHLFDLL